MSTVATLDGETLFGEVRWIVQAGTAPATGRFNVTKGAAARLLEGGLRPVTLKITSGGTTGEFRELYVIQQAPSDSPTWKTVLVADRRWFWRYRLARGLYNVRRQTGVQRLTGPDRVAPEVQLVVPVIAYAPFSLRNQTVPWRGREILERLLREASIAEKGAGGPGFTAAIETIADIPIENLEVTGSVADAIEQVLAFIPGARVTVDARGAVRVFDASSGAEEQIVEQIPAEIIGAGHVERCDLARLRPRHVDVFFGIEAELRVDGEEAQGAGSTSARDPDGRFVENVLSLPDFEQAIGGTNYVMHSWVPFDSVLPAWGALPEPIGVPLDFPLIRKAFVPGMDLWAGASLAGALTPRADWMGRIAAVQTHYRQTYRINQRWMARIFQLRPYRVALADVATGSRGPIGVWSDFCFLATQRSVMLERQANVEHANYAMNVVCYPEDGLLASAPIGATARVRIEDADQGILSVDYLADRFRIYEAALPSQIELEGANTQPGQRVMEPGPAGYLGPNVRGIAFNFLRRADRLPQLTARHKIAFVLTAVPGSPNGRGQLVRVRVTPGEVPAFPGQDRCEGPPLDFMVAPGLETARVAWSDANAATIEQAFGKGADDDVDAAPEALRPLIINLGAEAPAAGGASLTAIAKAAAARIYHQLRDRQEGQAATVYSPAMRPEGWLDAIVHEIDGKGVATSTIALPSVVPALRIQKWLDSSTRWVVMRLATGRPA